MWKFRIIIQIICENIAVWNEAFFFSHVFKMYVPLKEKHKTCLRKLVSYSGLSNVTSFLKYAFVIESEILIYISLSKKYSC